MWRWRSVPCMWPFGSVAAGVMQSHASSEQHRHVQVCSPADIRIREWPSSQRRSAGVSFKQALSSLSHPLQRSIVLMDAANGPGSKQPIRKPLVALVSTGGTIASTGADTLDLSDYHGPVLTGSEMVARVPELSSYAELVIVPFSNIASDRMGPPDWLLLHDVVNRLVDSDHVDGIVVTHGTATLEETAYFLNLTLKISVPVVVVGAQRPITGLSSDAPMNLVNAVRVAAAPHCAGKGVLVMLNDEIHAAREVTKSSVFRLHAFQTPELGALGHADPDQVVLYRAPLRKHYPDTVFDLKGVKELPRVDIVESYAGADGICVSACVDAGAKGLVIATLAPGTAPPEQTEAIVKAQKSGTIVAFATRSHGGRVGSIPSQQPAGIVLADNLSPQKARVLLILALAHSKDMEFVQDAFSEY